jgi:hypothetical protein
MPEETKNPMQELMDRKIWFLWIWSKDKMAIPPKSQSQRMAVQRVQTMPIVAHG